jgi:hypothetical protein
MHPLTKAEHSIYRIAVRATQCCRHSGRTLTLKLNESITVLLAGVTNQEEVGFVRLTALGVRR